MGIRVLGPLSLDETDFRFGRRDRVVLSVLAMHPGQTVTTDRIIDALWGETAPPSAAKVVQGCVMRLRRTLGRLAIETSGRGYALAISADEVDAQRFERMVVRGRELLALGEADRAAYLLGEALGVWQGQPYAELEGWDLAVIESGRLEGLRLDAEELKVEAALAVGHHREVIAEAHGMVQAAPMRERRWALLAHAQYQAGRQEEALRTIREIKTLLAQRLGLDPGPDLVALEQAILRQDESLVVSSIALSASATCPYQGLLPYDVDDAESFFGREASLNACLAILSEVSTLTVVGPSGGGKSSLVRAGVAAALRRQGRSVLVITPGAHPGQALSRLPKSGVRTVVVIDQCEEVFSLCDDAAERADFVSAVVRHAASGGPLVMALRADRLAEIATYPSFARLVEQGLHLLGAMSEDDLREAIVSPARQVGLLLEPGLVDLLLRDVQDEPGALPLLSHALLETWKRREGNTMTVEGYRATGAIRGAVAQSAEQVYAGIHPEQRHLLRDLLLRLVTHGVADEPVRSRVPRRLIGSDPEIDVLIDHLVAARLVSSDAGVLEVSHEALARAWPRLRAWLEDDVAGQRILHHLTGAADAWDSLGRPDSELYRGARSAQAIEWRDRQGTHLTETEAAFLEASTRIAQTEQRSTQERARLQARMIRRLRGVLAGAAVFLAAAVLAGLLAVQQADRADTSASAAADAARAADARRVGARALATDDISMSMLLAVAGARLHDSSTTRSNVLAVLAQHSQLIRSTPYGGDAVTGLDVSPDGHTLAAYDASGHVALFDAATMASRARFDPPTPRNPVEWFAPMAFSPDGNTLAVGLPALARIPLLLLDAQSLEQLPVQLRGLPAQPSRVLDITFSADGSAVAAIIQRLRRESEYWNVVRHAVLVWDLRTGEDPVLRMQRELSADAIFGHRSLVALSPDGRIVYNSAPLAAYDVASGATLYSRPRAFDSTGVPDHNSDFFELNPEGTLLAVTQVPDRLLLLDATTGEVRRDLRGHDERVTGLRFSNDGRLLASVSPDRSAIIWEVSTGEIREHMQLGEADVQALAFSPDATTLYTGGAGRSIRQWDLQGSRRFVSELVEPAEFTLSRVLPSPGGRFLASIGRYGTRFFDLSERTWTHSVRPDPGLLGGNWSSAGDQFATLGAGFVKLWDPMTGEVVAEASLDEKIVHGQFTRDDERIAIMSTDGRISMLDAESLEPVGDSVQLDGTGGGFSLGPDNHTVLRLTPGYQPDPTFEHRGRGWVLVDMQTRQVVNQGEVGFDTAWLASSPDGRHAAIGGDAGEVVMLDLESGTPLRPAVVGHSSTVWAMVYSPDGSRMVTTGKDGSVSLWDGASGELLGTVVLPERVTAAADFGANGHTIVIATDYESVYLWDTRFTHAMSFACTLAGRDFTRTEWMEVFGDRPHQEICPRT